MSQESRIFYYKTTSYRFEPVLSSVYKVQENSSYTKVVFEGPKKGIYSVIDRENEEIGYLLCFSCDSATEIVVVSSDFLLTHFNQVKKYLAAA